MAQVKKRLPRFETEGAILWAEEGYNDFGYKRVMVKTNPPQFLDKKFSGDDLKLVKEAFKESKDQDGTVIQGENIAFMAIHEKWTKGNEQEVVGNNCYLEYNIKVNPSKKEPKKKFVNMLIKKVEVLQEEDENAA